MENWFSREGVATHYSGYATYATIWFDGETVVAIEPHSAFSLKTGVADYYNRIMGQELSDYRTDLFFELPL